MQVTLLGAKLGAKMMDVTSVDQTARINAAIAHHAAGNHDAAIAELLAVLCYAPSSVPALKLLRVIRQATAQTIDIRDKEPFVDKCISYDGEAKDLRFLLAVFQFIQAMSPSLVLYGYGRFTKYLFSMIPAVRRYVRLILDDDPNKRGKGVDGIPTVPSSDIPSWVQSVLFCTTKTSTALAMHHALQRRGSNARKLPLTAISKLDPASIPEKAWLPFRPSIYPLDIPEIDFQPEMDFILLELPPRQIPMMPYGIGYVHNTLKRLGIRQQTMDLNIIFYHRYFTRRVVCYEMSPVWGDADPWDGLQLDKWTTQEALACFSDTIDEVVRRLVAARPKILGISLRHGVRPLAEKIIAAVKAQSPETIVVVGGYDCIFPANAAQKLDRFDYMVIGEAEETLPGLVRELMAGRRPNDLPGVISSFDSPGRQWVDGPLPSDLDALSFPMYDWFDVSVYRAWNGGKVVPFSIGRGCAWSKCNFCRERFCFRTRSPLKVVDEFEWYLRRGFDSFISMESDLNGDPSVLSAICEEIIRRGLCIALTGQLRVDRRSSGEFFRLLKSAGFYRLVFGVDGWNDHVLKLQRKGYSFKFVEQNLRDCHDAGIDTNVNMVIGVPGETEDDIDQCIDNIVRNKRHIGAITTLNMVRLFAGSPYYQSPEQFKISFRGDRDEIYRRDPDRIDDKLWYSEEPYIDHLVRVARYKKVFSALVDAGIEVGEFAKTENEIEIAKIEEPAS